MEFFIAHNKTSINKFKKFGKITQGKLFLGTRTFFNVISKLKKVERFEAFDAGEKKNTIANDEYKL